MFGNLHHFSNQDINKLSDSNSSSNNFRNYHL